MQVIQLVVFDMIGTVLHDDHAIEKSLLAAFQSMDLFVDPQQIVSVMGMEKREAIHTLCQHLTIQDPSLVENIYLEFQHQLRRLYMHEHLPAPFSDAEEVFAWLNQNHIQVALNTGFDRAITHFILQQTGWINHAHIQAVVSAEDVQHGRPHPDMIRHLMQLTGVNEASRVMKIGDTPMDIQEGRNAGCGCVVAVTTGSFDADAFIEYHPDVIIDRLSEIPRIVDSI